MEFITIVVLLLCIIVFFNMRKDDENLVSNPVEFIQEMLIYEDSAKSLDNFLRFKSESQLRTIYSAIDLLLCQLEQNDKSNSPNIDNNSKYLLREYKQVVENKLESFAIVRSV